MKYISVLVVSMLILIFGISNAQNDYYSKKDKWIAIAEANKPNLIEKIISPKHVVELVADSNSFQGWKAVPVSSVENLYNTSFKRINSVIVDFGNHYTGYLSMNFGVTGSTPDGPLRFKITFAEVPAELAQFFDPYPGAISRAWLQDEIVTVMDANSEIKLDRRISGRYLKIELLASSPYFDFTISNLRFNAVTSAVLKPEPLQSSADDIITEIDKIGLNTLKECMQTVFEDGPKRDRRLWIGDLYLESLANSFSYKNHDLTKRCLYLLAALTDERGYLHGTVFETPEPHPQKNQFLLDYALLYNVTLKEYLEYAGDTATAIDLFPVAKRQLNIIKNYLLSDGSLDFTEASSEWWLFFDWKDELNKDVALHGLALFALNNTYQLAELLNREEELKEIPELIDKMKKSALKFYNNKTNLFESNINNQVSYASQIWMILGGVLSEKESRKTLEALLKNEKAVLPGGPYMYHYFIQALINSGMDAEAKQYLIEYWGGMVEKGADTFWEVYSPTNDFLSPYNFYPVNSYCHAWSCTPVYFIRKYPTIFQ